jgi:hypothetical protein
MFCKARRRRGQGESWLQEDFFNYTVGKDNGNVGRTVAYFGAEVVLFAGFTGAAVRAHEVCDGPDVGKTGADVNTMGTVVGVPVGMIGAAVGTARSLVGAFLGDTGGAGDDIGARVELLIG